MVKPARLIPHGVHAACVAVALVTLALPARAEDLGNSKNTIPTPLESLGIQIFGLIDAGYAYQTHGVKQSGNWIGLNDYIIATPNANRSISTLSNNLDQQSQAGLKLESSVGYDTLLIGRLSTAFNPLYGEVVDACKAQTLNAGRAPSQWTAVYDAGRCGQAFTDDALIGLSNPTYGTLTAGRQTQLGIDSFVNYDATRGYSTSLLTGTGLLSSMGGFETTRWDNSAKYQNKFGPVRVGLIYGEGSEDSAIHHNAYGGKVGLTLGAFSLDAVYEKQNSIVSASPLPVYTPNSLSAIISDEAAYTVMAKYTFDIGGGYKDNLPVSKLMFDAGYIHMNYSNPNDPVRAGSTTFGGYVLASVNNAAFVTDRNWEMYWGGVKYELPSGWSFGGSYYYLHQDAFTFHPNLKLPAFKPCSGNSAPSCSGDSQVVAFRGGYQLNKYVELYAGFNYSTVAGGFDSQAQPRPQLQDNSAMVATGMVVKF